MAVNILDIYWKKCEVGLDQLPVLAITSLFISSKYENRCSPKLGLFLHVANYCCNEDEVYRYEESII